MNNIFRILLIIFFSFFFITTQTVSEEKKIKIGLLVPLTGDNAELGKQIVKAVRMALKNINTSQIEIYPKDTQSDPNITLRSAMDLELMGINLVIGPIFYKNLTYLEDVSNVTFLSLTNKTLDLPKNVISAGVNSTSQLSAIKKFTELYKIKKPIFLIPNLNYDQEIERGIKNSKINFFKQHYYDIEPTKLTKQIEKITNYKIRKQNVLDEINRIKKSDLEELDKKKQIEKLEKRYSLGNLNFDSIIISDFDESLKSVITSLLYTDVLPENKHIITFNQWFDKSLINEKTLQPIYYPSINKKNLENFKEKFDNEFNEKPNHLTLLSYDLVGLIYYLSIKNNILEIDNLFKKKNSFKGKIGIFDIQDNKIIHRLSFYQIYEGKLKEIF